MSGIVGSRLNIRGSGLVGSLGTDGQVLTSSGAGVGAVYEAAAGGMSVSDITGATDIAAIPDNTDELVLSDAGTLKRIDYSDLVPFGSVGGCFTKAEQTDLCQDTYIKVTLDTTVFNRGLTFASNTITIPAGGDGDYFISTFADFNSYGEGKFGSGMVCIYVNGGGVSYSTINHVDPAGEFNSQKGHVEVSRVVSGLNATDTIDLYVNANINKTGHYNRFNLAMITLFRINNN